MKIDGGSHASVVLIPRKCDIEDVNRMLRKQGTLVLTYGTYLPTPHHDIVKTFQLIQVGSSISLDITLGFPPHHLQQELVCSVGILFDDTSQKLQNCQSCTPVCKNQSCQKSLYFRISSKLFQFNRIFTTLKHSPTSYGIRGRPLPTILVIKPFER